MFRRAYRESTENGRKVTGKRYNNYMKSRLGCVLVNRTRRLSRCFWYLQWWFNHSRSSLETWRVRSCVDTGIPIVKTEFSLEPFSSVLKKDNFDSPSSDHPFTRAILTEFLFKVEFECLPYSLNKVKEFTFMLGLLFFIFRTTTSPNFRTHSNSHSDSFLTEHCLERT